MASITSVLTRYHEGKGTTGLANDAAVTADTGKLGFALYKNPNVRAFLNSLGDGKDSKAPLDANQQRLADSLIDNWKKNPEFMANLNKDLANPATAAKLQAAIKTNPAGVSAALDRYQPGKLDEVIPAAPAKPAPAATNTTSAADIRKAEAAAAAAAAGTSSSAPARANNTPAAPARTNTSAQTTPAQTAPAQTPPAQTTPSAAEVAASSAADREANRAILKEIAKGTDEEIRAGMDQDFVKRLADGLADYGTENFKIGPEADGFRNNVKTNDGLQKRIAENLKNNPQLIRELAGAMENKEAAGGIAGSAIKGKLQEIYKNPETLAQKDYTDSLLGDMKMAKGGIGGMLNNIFGEGTMGGIGGMVNGIGGFFQGIMNWFSNFFEAFSSGNFAVMGNVDPKMSFWNKLSYSMDRAANASQLVDSARVLPRDGATNPKVGNGMVFDKAGKPVMEDVLDNTGKPIGQRQQYDPTQDHRISVGGHKFYITGNLQPTPVLDANGNSIGKNRFYVATEVGPDGRATNVKEIVLGKDDTNKLMDRIDQASRAAGVENRIVHPDSAPTRQHQGFSFAGTRTTYYDTKGTQIGDADRPSVHPAANDPNYNSGATAHPVQPNGPVVGRPLDEAANDPTLKLTVGAP